MTTTIEPEWEAAVGQASAWIALLHGPTRTAEMERAVQRWLKESPLHQQAFELATDTWNEQRAAHQRAAAEQQTRS